MKPQHTFYLLLAAGLLLLPLLFYPADVVTGHIDALFYHHLLLGVQDHLLLGNLWPRWWNEANAGLGSPVFLVYPPLPYLLSSLPLLPLRSIMDASDPAMFVLAMLLPTIAYAVTTYFWIHHHVDRRASLIAALMAVLSPYLLIIWYLHANIAQLWAIALLPLWMISAEKLARGRLPAIPAFSLIAAATALCHPLTVLACGALPVIYAMFLGYRHLIRTAFYLTTGTALGAALSSFYWVPMLEALPWMQTGAFTQDKRDVLENLNHIDMIFFLPVMLLSYIACRTFYRHDAISGTGFKTPVFAWAILLMLTLFLTTSASAFIWKNLPLIHYLQFPAARLMPVAMLGLSYGIGVLVWRLPKYTPLFVLLVLALIPFSLYRIQNTYQHADDTITRDYINQMHHDRISPIAMLALPKATPLTPADIYQRRKELSKREWSSGAANKAFLKTKQGYQITSQQSKPVEVTVKQFYTPQWTATSDASLSLTSNKEGLIQLTLPKGKEHISLKHSRSYYEPIAQQISIATCCLWLFLTVIALRQSIVSQGRLE